MSAISCWTSWKPAIGRPNCSRSPAYRSDASSAACAMPVHPAASEYRPESSALSALDSGRYSLAAGCTGIAQAALDASLRYAGEREQFGRPIAGFQLVQELIADIYLDVQAARALYWKVAWRHERGERHTIESSVAKTFCSEAAVRCADRAVQVHGGYGYIDEYPVGRYLRDARVTTLYEGTSQIQRLLLGRHLTGLNAFT